MLEKGDIGERFGRNKEICNLFALLYSDEVKVPKMIEFPRNCSLGNK